MMPPCVRSGVKWLGWSRNQMRSHSSRMARRSSDVKMSSCARRAGSAEYIGIKQPEPESNDPAATSAKSILRIRRSPRSSDQSILVVSTYGDARAPSALQPPSGGITTYPHIQTLALCATILNYARIGRRSTGSEAVAAIRKSMLVKSGERLAASAGSAESRLHERFGTVGCGACTVADTTNGQATGYKPLAGKGFGSAG